MHYLILDTCIWINMAKDPWDSHLVQLCELIEEGRVTILLPTIIRDEWNRNRYEKVQRPAVLNIENKINMLKNLKQILPKGNELQDSLNLVTKLLHDQTVGEFAQKGINFVEYIFQHESTKHFILTPDVQQLAIEQGLRKEAPFQNKNSIADALLMFSFVDYTRKHKIRPVLFVTDNSDDFSKSKNKKELLNDDLKKFMEPYGIQYYVSIGKVLQSIKEASQEEVDSQFVFRNLGKLEAYIDDNHVKSISLMENGNGLVIKSNGQRERLTLGKDDFESCLQYFNHFVEEHEFVKISTTETMEVMIYKSPPATKKSIYIRKKEKYVTLSECH